MLSRVMNKNLLRGSAAMSKMVKPGNYVCFCGCSDPNHLSKSMINMTKRNFQGHLGLDSTADLVPVQFKA